MSERTRRQRDYIVQLKFAKKRRLEAEQALEGIFILHYSSITQKGIRTDGKQMISKDILNAVDRVFKDIFKSENPILERVPFGGRAIVFGGDFRQVLPVIPKGSRGEIVDPCINRSPIWPSVRVLPLRINMRVRQALTENNDMLATELQDFADFLLRVGSGTENNVGATDLIRIPDGMILPGDDVEVLSSWVFGNISQFDINVPENQHILTSRAILTSKNAGVSRINNLLVIRFPGEVYEYLSSDQALDEDDQLHHPVEFLNSIESGGIPAHRLRLKIGSPIMILRNIDPTRGLCNGTRLICRSFRPHVIEAVIVSGEYANQVVLIPRITIIPTSNQSIIPFKRRQFPISISFCMTVNKSQGQTLDRVGLYLPDSVFSHGQLYAALSRVRSHASIRLMLSGSDSIVNGNEGRFTRNVVYSEVFT